MNELTNYKEVYLHVSSLYDCPVQGEPYLFCFSHPKTLTRPFLFDKGAFTNPDIYQMDVEDEGEATLATLSKGKIKTTIYHKGEHSFRFALSEREQGQSVLTIDKEGNRKNIPLRELIKVNI